MDDLPDLVSINCPASSKTCIKAVAISRNVLNGIPFFLAQHICVILLAMMLVEIITKLALFTLIMGGVRISGLSNPIESSTYF
eukprot:9933378-Heterocapsa_arctica.AAC.1